MVDRDIVKSMTDVCDGGAYIENHCGAEEARQAHNLKDG